MTVILGGAMIFFSRGAGILNICRGKAFFHRGNNFFATGAGFTGFVPEGVFELSKITTPLPLVLELFCSNTKNLEVEAINFLSLINNRLTLTLSSADDFFCRVFCPHTTTP